jgi:hypothetical protein
MSDNNDTPAGAENGWSQAEVDAHVHQDMPAGAEDLIAQDQPEPAQPQLQVIESTYMADALIVLKNGDGELHMEVKTEGAPNVHGNMAHFFAMWINREYPMLVSLAAREFNAHQALEEERSRNRLRLVDANGDRIVGG